jgi:hypothetical protein
VENPVIDHQPITVNHFIVGVKITEEAVVYFYLPDITILFPIGNDLRSGNRNIFIFCCLINNSFGCVTAETRAYPFTVNTLVNRDRIPR